MAIFDKTNPEGAAQPPAPQQDSPPEAITPEAITGHSERVGASAYSAASTLPAALEPELRRIIDTAVARVATIELEAIREARELTQRSEVEAREALRFALDRAFNLINSLELLAMTVNGMAEALKTELDDAITALRSVPEPESELARELAQQPAAQVPPVEEPQPAAPAPEPPAEPVDETPAPEVETPPAPAPELVAEAPAPEVEAPPAPEPQPVAEEPSAEPRVKLAGLVRPADGAAPEPPAEEPQPALVTAGAPAPSPPPRKGRVRRFFTR